MLLQRGFKPFVLAQQKFKTSTDFFRVLSSGALAGLYTNVFKVCHVLRKTFELQSFINEPGFLFKFSSFHLISVDDYTA